MDCNYFNHFNIYSFTYIPLPAKEQQTNCLSLILTVCGIRAALFGQNIYSANDTIKHCDSIYIAINNDTNHVVVFNSYCLIPGFASRLFASPWNPSENEMNAIFSESNNIFISKELINTNWQQYVCGLDTIGDKIVFIRYIQFTDQTLYLKDYFLKKIIFVYDDPLIHTVFYNFTTKKLISFY